MIQVTPHIRVLVAVEPVDFRNGIDGLAALCRRKLSADPFSGTIFVFRNRRGTAVKLLVFDSQGFWLAQKRLSTGRFRYWPDGRGDTQQLEAHELQLLLSAGNPESGSVPAPWKRIEKSG